MEALFTQAWWIIAALALVAGVARGLAGFGVGLVMMPVGALLVTPQVMVPVIAAIDIPIALYLMGPAWRQFDRRSVAILGGAAVLGLPLGVFALTVVSAETLALSVNALALAAAIALLAGLRLRGRDTATRTFAIGALSGVLQGSVSLPGPPIILGWIAAQLPGAVLRANIIMYFLLIDVIVVPMHAYAGLFTQDAVILAISLTPIYFLGTVLGQKSFGHVPEDWFRRVVLGLVILGAVGGIAMSVFG